MVGKMARRKNWASLWNVSYFRTASHLSGIPVKFFNQKSNPPFPTFSFQVQFDQEPRKLYLQLLGYTEADLKAKVTKQYLILLAYRLGA